MWRPAGVLALVSLAACSDGLGPSAARDARWAHAGLQCSPDAPAVTAPEKSDALGPPFVTIDARWADIARRAPGGWGGYFLDGNTTIMYLVDPSQKEAAVAFLQSEGVPVSGSTVVRQGRWDFAQLYDWYLYLNRHVWKIAGVSFSDIQETRNRIEYGAIDEPTREAVTETLGELGVPCYLVAIAIQQYLTSS